VADASADAVVCVWMGEDGDLFRESLPPAVLDAIEVEIDDDEDDDDLTEDDAEASKVA